MPESSSYGVRLLKRFNVNRVSRLSKHYRAIRSELAPRNAKEREEAEFFMDTFEQHQRSAQHLITLRFVFYCILYATILVNILQVIPFLHFLVQFIEFGSSLVGTGLAFVVVMTFTALINTQLQLMNQCLAHLAPMYQASTRRDTAKVIRALRRTL